MTIRYRTGIDETTGKPLVGYDHLQQSLATIFGTRLQERVMLLGFGADLLGEIGRNLYAGEVLKIYGIIVGSINKWEPEYRVATMALVSLTRAGGLALAMAGTYFPEGRFGNYTISEPADFNLPLIEATI